MEEHQQSKRTDTVIWQKQIFCEAKDAISSKSLADDFFKGLKQCVHMILFCKICTLKLLFVVQFLHIVTCFCHIILLSVATGVAKETFGV